MTLHSDARAVLAGWAPPSARDAELRDRFVAHLDAHEDAMTRACLPDHLTAGTIVLTPEADAVLLNHHRKADGWFAFGGHCEPGDTTLAGVALREAHEESGLADLDFDPVPLDLDEHAVRVLLAGHGRAPPRRTVPRHGGPRMRATPSARSRSTCAGGRSTRCRRSTRTCGG